MSQGQMLIQPSPSNSATALPAIIHALKVQQAAEDACQEMTWAEFIGKKWPALMRAVKGEQP